MKDDWKKEAEDLRDKSLSGESARRDNYVKRQQEQRRMRRIRRQNEENRSKRLKVFFFSALAAVAIILGPNTVSAISNEFVVKGMVDDFQAEVVSNYTYRTDDNLGHWYNYQDIADVMNDYARENGLSDCQVIYLSEKALGNGSESDDKYQMNELLKYTEYGNIDNFFQRENYKDIEDFNSSIEKELLMHDEKNKEQTELEEMKNDRESSLEQESGKSMGGK